MEGVWSAKRELKLRLEVLLSCKTLLREGISLHSCGRAAELHIALSPGGQSVRILGAGNLHIREEIGCSHREKQVGRLCSRGP